MIKCTTQRLVRWICGIVLASGSLAQAQSSFSLKREAVIERVGQNVVIQFFKPSPSPQTAEEIAAVVKSIIQDEAPNILPVEVTAPSENTLDLVLKVPMPIEFENRDYIRSRVRFYLYSIPMKVRYLEVFPPATNEQVDAIKKSVNDLLSGVRAEMERELIPLNLPSLTQQTIGKTINGFERSMTAGADDPFSLQLSVPIGPADTNAFIADFSDRLSGSITLLKDQFVPMAATRPDDPMAMQRATYVLSQVLRPVYTFVLDKTTDPLKKSYDFSKIAPPGWQAARDDFARASERMRIQYLSTRSATTRNVDRAATHP